MITGQTTSNTYQGDGSNRVWNISFEFTDSSQIKFKVNGETVETNFALNTVAKTLTYPTVASELDPLTSADEIEIYRDTSITQDIDFVNGGPLNAEMIEDGLDKLTMISQEIKEIAESKAVEDGLKVMPDGTDIDTLKEEGVYFIFDVTSTKDLPLSQLGSSGTPFAIVRVTKPPIDKGTYFVYQEMTLWWMYTGVSAISEPRVYVRNLTDYTYMTGYQEWKSLGNEMTTTKVTGTSVSISAETYRDYQVIVNPTSNYSIVPSTAITSLTITNSWAIFSGKMRVIFKVGSGFSLTVTGNDYWIGTKPTTWTEGNIYAITMEAGFLKCEEVTMS